MSGSICQSCKAKTEGARLCDKCTREWRRELESMPGVRAALQSKAMRQASRPQGGGSRRGTLPQPVDWTASMQLEELDQWVQWVASLADQRMWCVRDWRQCLAVAITGLGRIAAASPEAGYARDMTHRMLARCERLCDPPMDRRPVGDCPGCGQTLFACESDVTVRCRVCGTVSLVSVLEESRAARIREETAWHEVSGTPAQIARWLSVMTGVHVTGRRVRVWLHRGKLAGDSLGDGVYRVSCRALLDALDAPLDRTR